MIIIYTAFIFGIIGLIMYGICESLIYSDNNNIITIVVRGIKGSILGLTAGSICGIFLGFFINIIIKYNIINFI
jgi:hypothetical protein